MIETQINNEIRQRMTIEKEKNTTKTKRTRKRIGYKKKKTRRRIQKKNKKEEKK